MLSVDEALALVLEQASPLRPSTIAREDALGFTLAERIASDIDSPPHDKSIVDGYAVIAAEIRQSGTELTVLEQIVAGMVPTQTVEPGSASQIMTGAPLPAGADAVVMVEQTQAAGNRVRIQQSPVKPGQNIMRRGVSLRRGQTVLESGKQLRAIELGVLAEAGRTEVSVIPRPRVAVLATGNELVDAARVPAASQIRNSNGPLLAGLIRQAGGAAVPLGIARDEVGDLRSHISKGLAQDVLLLSGGVSAGVLDLVPQVLAELGVRQLFHKVSVKPGKPLWFGIKDQTLVFGLPGNPVSALVCFELFVRPAIEKLGGRPPTGLPRASGQLTQSHPQRGDRTTYWPAQYNAASGAVSPLAWHGSGDLRTLADADCLIYLPPEDRLFAAGDAVTLLLLPQS